MKDVEAKAFLSKCFLFNFNFQHLKGLASFIEFDSIVQENKRMLQTTKKIHDGAVLVMFLILWALEKMTNTVDECIDEVTKSRTFYIQL